MLKEEPLELLSRITKITDQPFRGLEQSVLVVYFDTGPRWSNPAEAFAQFQKQSQEFLQQLARQHPDWQPQAAREIERAEPLIAAFLRSPQRDAGLLLMAGEWAELLEVSSLPVVPSNQFHYDYYLHLETWLKLMGKPQAEVTHWLQHKAVADRVRDPDFIQRLGYGALDLQRGEWYSAADVVPFAHPPTDPHSYARQLLQLLDKRFPDALAVSIWEAILQYQAVRKLNGAPALNMTELAREWYRLYGVAFVKAWYFGPACPPRHYLLAGSGHECQPGLLRRFLGRQFPFIELLGQAGFRFGQFCRLLLLHPAFSWRGLTGREEVFWPWLVASLNAFALSAEELRKATLEIQGYAERLKLPLTPSQRNLSLCEASIDYFRRLELAGLGPEAIAAF